ncbi:MAG: hypothetical protein ACLSGN_08685 [Oscillospiraceae bacterium]
MYNEIKLEKGLYNLAGKSFTQALAAADPDENFEGKALNILTLLKDSSKDSISK